jgi:hypothetical protein
MLTYLSATGLLVQDYHLVNNQMLKADQPCIHYHSETMQKREEIN